MNPAGGNPDQPQNRPQNHPQHEPPPDGAQGHPQWESAGGQQDQPPGGPQDRPWQQPGGQQGAPQEPGQPHWQTPGSQGMRQEPGGQQYQPGYAAPGAPYGAPPAQPRNGFGVAALVLGIVAIVLFWIPFVDILGIILGILAIVFGVVGIARVRTGQATNRGMAIAGIVTGAIGVVLSAAMLILFGVGLSYLFSPEGRQYTQCVQQANGNQAEIQHCNQMFRYRMNGG